MDAKRLDLAVNTLRIGFQAVADDGALSLAQKLEENLVILEQEHAEQLRLKDEENKALREALDQERNIADMLYHGIKAGHPIGGKRMNESLRTAEAWMEHGRKP